MKFKILLLTAVSMACLSIPHTSQALDEDTDSSRASAAAGAAASPKTSSGPGSPTTETKEEEAGAATGGTTAPKPSSSEGSSAPVSDEERIKKFLIGRDSNPSALTINPENIAKALGLSTEVVHEHLSNVLRNFKNLKKLQITGLDPSKLEGVKMENVEELLVKDSKLTQGSISSQVYPSLTDLTLQNCTLEADTFKGFSLQRLTISGGTIGLNFPDIVTIKNLENLSLASLDLGQAIWSSGGLVSSPNPTLKNLSLSFNPKEQFASVTSTKSPDVLYALLIRISHLFGTLSSLHLIVEAPEDLKKMKTKLFLLEKYFKADSTIYLNQKDINSP